MYFNLSNPKVLFLLDLFKISNYNLFKKDAEKTLNKIITKCAYVEYGISGDRVKRVTQNLENKYSVGYIPSIEELLKYGLVFDNYDTGVRTNQDFLNRLNFKSKALDVYIDSLSKRQMHYLKSNKLIPSEYRTLGSVILGDWNQSLVIKDATRLIVILKSLDKGNLTRVICQVLENIENKNLAQLFPTLDTFRYLLYFDEYPANEELGEYLVQIKP